MSSAVTTLSFKDKNKNFQQLPHYALPHANIRVQIQVFVPWVTTDLNVFRASRSETKNVNKTKYTRSGSRNARYRESKQAERGDSAEICMRKTGGGRVIEMFVTEVWKSTLKQQNMTNLEGIVFFLHLLILVKKLHKQTFQNLKQNSTFLKLCLQPFFRCMRCDETDHCY